MDPPGQKQDNESRKMIPTERTPTSTTSTPAMLPPSQFVPGYAVPTHPSVAALAAAMVMPNSALGALRTIASSATTPVATIPTTMTTSIPHISQPVAALSGFVPSAGATPGVAALSQQQQQQQAAATDGGLEKKSTKKEKSSKKKKSPSSSSSSSSSSSPPSQTSLLNGKKVGKRSYVQLAHEAIVALNDRTGSSQIAIQKYLLSTYSTLKDGRPFKTRMGGALKSGVNNKRFVKVKCSYKISPEWIKKNKKKKDEHNPVDMVMRKKTMEQEKKLQELAKTMTPEEFEKVKMETEKELEKQRKKEEAAHTAREREERLAKRKLPMDDTQLHREDKELGIPPPEDVQKRPNLPHFLSLTKRDNNNNKTAKADYLDYGSQGLVTDLLQVYHFFQGDVHCDDLVPRFRLQNLIYAVDEVLMGNSRKSRLVPPLLVHLFCVCLHLLTTLPETADETPAERRLREDLVKLGKGLSPVSWGEVCVMYMDAMERYYTSAATYNPDVLPPGQTDIQYLMRVTDTPTEAVRSELPEGYCGYLGDSRSTLARAHAKLYKQDAWTLSAEELMALLRALTDDVLCCRPEIAADISDRETEMAKLLKQKKAADYTYRKTRCAYEGPKKLKKSERMDANNNNNNNTNEENEAPNQTGKWKPTATKKQFEAAVRAQQKANEAYEKGLKRLVSRTEPVGRDRHFNSYYCFHHDPEVLYVETVRSPTGLADYLPSSVQMNRTMWQVVDNKSTFDALTASLDIRGIREHDLYEALLGQEGTNQSLGRHLFDDVKEKNAIAGRKRRREELEEKKVKAQAARTEEEDGHNGGGRRSGRLHGTAQSELESIQKEIEELNRKIQLDETPYEPDYEELTGLTSLQKFDVQRRRKTRRAEEGNDLDIFCSNLLVSGKVDDTGLLGSMVSQILRVEELCEDLSAWEQPGVDRTKWIANLEKLVSSWNAACPYQLGPEEVPEKRDWRSPTVKRLSSDELDAKRQRVLESPGVPAGQASTSFVLQALKQPLLDLEQRVFEVTGLAMANRDADIADDNMSTAAETATLDEEGQKDADERQRKNAWRRIIHALRRIPAKKCGMVREHVANAITAARKANFGNVVSDLRAAMMEYQPDAAGDCRRAAIAVLDKYGGYEEDEDDADENEEDKEGAAAINDEEGGGEEEKLPSNLCGEAMMITGSLLGDEGANRVDWRDAVKSCRTLSRLAALSCAFCKSATKLLDKLHNERKALDHIIELWQKEEDRRSRSRSNSKNNSKIHAATEKALNKRTEVWADVQYTDDFCMVKIDDFPWWPAKKCIPKDSHLTDSLKSLNRELVSVVGEDGNLRLVKPDNIAEFSGTIDKTELVGVKRDIRSQLLDCAAMARRIVRGLNKTNKQQE